MTQAYDCPPNQEKCCQACKPGEKLDFNTNSCKICPGGRSCQSIDWNSQQVCPKGSYSPEGELACRKCSKGSHSCDEAGMDAPDPCPNKKQCDDPANPTLCEAGYMCLLGGQKIECGNGNYSDAGMSEF